MTIEITEEMLTEVLALEVWRGAKIRSVFPPEDWDTDFVARTALKVILGYAFALAADAQAQAEAGEDL